MPSKLELVAELRVIETRRVDDRGGICGTDRVAEVVVADASGGLRARLPLAADGDDHKMEVAPDGSALVVTCGAISGEHASCRCWVLEVGDDGTLRILHEENRTPSSSRAIQRPPFIDWAGKGSVGLRWDFADGPCTWVRLERRGRARSGHAVGH